MAHGFQSALSGSRFYQAPGFAGGKVTVITLTGNAIKQWNGKGYEEEGFKNVRKSFYEFDLNEVRLW